MEVEGTGTGKGGEGVVPPTHGPPPFLPLWGSAGERAAGCRMLRPQKRLNLMVRVPEAVLGNFLLAADLTVAYFYFSNLFFYF